MKVERFELEFIGNKSINTLNYRLNTLDIVLLKMYYIYHHILKF
jgi:hypothetical protein